MTSSLRPAVLLALSWCLAAHAVRAELTRAEPLEPIRAVAPAAAAGPEVSITLHVVVGVTGEVESLLPVERAPLDAPEAFVEAALAAVRAAKFRPSLRDGVPVRSRIACRVNFPRSEPQAGAHEPALPSASLGAAPSLEDEPGAFVEVRGSVLGSLRGLGDFRIERERLEASPRQQTSEMLAAAPGVFVDHEDGEGLGNDVYLRGFDLEHGSGIELCLGAVPLNSPTHIRGPGYADVDFIIPEVVSSIHVLQGPYDPRQGDAAIVGSATFELGVRERGYQLKTSYGSFGQLRVMGLAAPRGASDGTFVALALRGTDGFGMKRSGRSGSLNGQYELELGRARTLRLFATAYAADASFAGVTREDDVAAGRIGFYDSYPYFADNQGVGARRVLLGADFAQDFGKGRLKLAPFAIWTDFVARENFTGSLESSQLDPSQFGRGDLFETTNRETALGLNGSFRSAPLELGRGARLTLEPGLFVRAGHTRQARRLLDPGNLEVWDRRRELTLGSLDLGMFADLEFSLGRSLRVSGGPRADLLVLAVDDALAGAQRSAAGVVFGPRASVDYSLFSELALVAAYGEGFRSLDAERLPDGSTRPYSKVRSVEGGVRVEDAGRRLRSSVALFSSWVENELVFVAEEGGLETQNESVRRGFVGALLLRPWDFLLASSSLSVVDARFATLVAGVSHHVPNVPPLLFHAELAVTGRVLRYHGRPVAGRIGLGYTLSSGVHLSDQRRAPDSHALNLGGRVRYGAVEVGLDVFNVLGMRLADSSDQYVSNWGFSPGQLPAAAAVHTRAAPPRTFLASLALSP